MSRDQGTPWAKFGSRAIWLWLFLLYVSAFSKLTASWTGQDIGSVGVAGSDSLSGSTYTLQGSGVDIGGTADSFHFVYQSMAGDGELVARVATVQNTSATAKAGLMIRQSTSAGDIEAFIGVEPAGSKVFLNRTSAGGNTTSASVGTSSLPSLLRIMKDGTLITVYQSSDGSTWAYDGFIRLSSLSNPVDIGMAVTSDSNSTLCTATFDNISLTTATNFQPSSPWVDADIGTVGQTGAVHLEKSVWSLFGAGSGLTGSADSFNFAYQKLSGNGMILAKVSSLSSSAASGVVMRQDLTAGSAGASVQLKPTGVSLITRSSAGSSCSTTAGASVGPPYWVKLVRLGSVFYGYQSSDGLTWSSLGSQTITMSGPIYVGLLTTSGSTTTLGVGTLANVAVVPSNNYLVTGAIAAGSNHTIYLDPSGNVWGWGLNSNGQLGDGTTTNRSTPVQSTTLSSMEAVTAGNSHSLGLANDGTVWAWGGNDNGQLGDGTTTQHATPKHLTTPTGMVALSAGTGFSLGLASDGTVWAWGNNANGQLGDGTTSSHSNPTHLTFLSGIVAISAGTSFSLALDNGGHVWAWGLNSSHQLGDGTTTQQISPKEMSLSGIIAISAGATHSLALDVNGAIWAWGDNSSGELGVGNTTTYSSPVNVSSLSGMSVVDAGNLFGLGLSSTGSISSWGSNTSGQLGNNTTTEENSPVSVLTLSTAVAISCGTSHSVAITSNGAIWAWGSNSNGQLGNGSGSSSLVPTALTPSITSSLNASGSTGSAFSYTITGSGGPTSFSASSLPGGLSLNASTGVISGTPTSVGTYPVTIGATNISGTGTATLTISITVPPPVISSSGSDTCNAGAAYSYTITASNSPTSFNASNLPSGLSINTSSGVISGHPASQGSPTIGLSATNSGGTGTKNLALTIKPAAPTISSPTTATGTVNVPFNYTITTYNSATSYNATGLPAGLSVNTSSGLISGTPTSIGTTSNVTIKATNGTGTGSQTISITINPPPPVITSGTTATGSTGAAFNYSITATNSPTSFNATGLPAGLSVNTATGAISGTPSASGVSNVSLSATNAGGTGTSTLTLTVNPPPPSITSLSTATAVNGTAFSYTITASNSPSSFNATPLPPGLGVNTSSGVISGTPTALGATNVTISAVNSGGTGSKTLTITVNPPAPVVTSAGTATGNSGLAFGYTITATNSPTSYGATGLPAGLSINTFTGAISGSPTSSGVTTATISATNITGTGSTNLQITIGQAPPVTSGLAMWLKTDQGLTQSGGVVTGWADQSTNGNNATPVGSPTVVPNGLGTYSGVHIDGSGNNYFTIADSSSLRPSNYTVLAVTKDSGLTGQQQFLLCRPYTTSGGYGGWTAPFLSYAMLVDENSSTYVGSYVTVAGTNSGTSGTNLYNLGYAHQFSWRYDGSNQQAYSNGTLAASLAQTGSVDYSGGSQNIVIGIHSSTDLRGTLSEPLNGDVYEILFYNRALSDTELQQAQGYLANKYGLYSPNATWPLSYSSAVQTEITRFQWNKSQADAYVALTSSYPTLPTAGLAMWLRTDAGLTQTGGTVTGWSDQTPNANNATAAGSPTIVSNGIGSQSGIHFDGTGNNYLTVPDSPSLRPNTYTVLAVAKDSGLTGQQQFLVSRPYTSSGAYGGWTYPFETYSMLLNESSTTYVGSYDTVSVTNFGTSGANVYYLNEPHQLGWRYDGTNQQAYANGTLAASGSMTGNLDYTGGSTNLVIGIHSSTDLRGTLSEPLNADVYEVLFYSRALSDTELQQAEVYLANKYSLEVDLPAPTITPNGGSFTSSTSVSFGAIPSPAVIRYTLDGSLPTATSTLYTTAFNLTQSAPVNAAIFLNNIEVSPVSNAQFYVGDTGSIGIPDAWQTTYFGHTGISASALSPGRSGLTNLQDYLYGYNPNLFSTNGDGLSDLVNHILGISATNTTISSDGLTNAQNLLLGIDPFNSNEAPITPPATNPNDHTAPVINLVEPGGATLIP